MSTSYNNHQKCPMQTARSPPSLSSPSSAFLHLSSALNPGISSGPQLATEAAFLIPWESLHPGANTLPTCRGGLTSPSGSAQLCCL